MLDDHDSPRDHALLSAEHWVLFLTSAFIIAAAVSFVSVTYAVLIAF